MKRPGGEIEMTTENKTALTSAIDRSQSHNERVAVEYAGTHDSLMADLYELIDSDTTEIDYTTENDGTIDAWAFDPADDGSSMIWRLRVTLVDAD